MSRKPAKEKERAALEERIGYKFADKDLIERAITHISALSGGNRANSYQRLEFLGDHVLGLVISDMLYKAFPRANEGELSRRLSDLVRKETCAEVARAMDIGPALKLGSSESHAGGSGGLNNGSNNNQVGVANPGLGTLASNGGPTQTVALLPGSPA